MVGESGLDGTTILPAPLRQAVSVDGLAAVKAMHLALSSTKPQTAWLVSTGSLTNIALLFALHPNLADHIAGLSVMGGAIGGFFTSAPIGRLNIRAQLASHLSSVLPTGLPDNSAMGVAEFAKQLRELGVVQNAGNVDDAELQVLLHNARRSFGNTTDYAEFNIYCDPESASSIFSNPRLAAKTTLIPLDVTHQVLGNADVQKLLSNEYAGTDKFSASPVRHLFLEILTFFAQTYEREFAMSDGPPLHDPIAVAAAYAPEMFDDNGGERFEVFIVTSGEEQIFEHQRITKGIGQCGRTVARMVPKGHPGVRIPRSLQVTEFWQMVHLALASADAVSSMTF